MEICTQIRKIVHWGFFSPQITQINTELNDSGENSILYLC